MEALTVLTVAQALSDGQGHSYFFGRDRAQVVKLAKFNRCTYTTRVRSIAIRRWSDAERPRTSRRSLSLFQHLIRRYSSFRMGSTTCMQYIGSYQETNYQVRSTGRPYHVIFTQLPDHKTAQSRPKQGTASIVYYPWPGIVTWKHLPHT
jgi:hypothetical protein